MTSTDTTVNQILTYKGWYAIKPKKPNQTK